MTERCIVLYKKLVRHLNAVVIAALALAAAAALLAACTFTGPQPEAATKSVEATAGSEEGLRYIPGYGVFESADEILTLTAPVVFDFAGLGVQTLTHAVLEGGRLTLVFSGSYTDGREESSSFGGSWGIGPDYMTLSTGGQSYAPAGYKSYAVKSTSFGMTCYFDLPEGTLTDGETYTLVLDRQDTLEWYAEVPFSLSPAQTIDSLSDLGLYAQNNAVRLAAVPAQGDGQLKIDLYSQNTLGMEFISYSGGSVEPVPGAQGMLRLGSSEGDLYRREQTVSKLYYPISCTFDVGSSTNWSLYVPYVILRDRENETVTRSFSSKEEALAYEETLQLKNSTLTLTVREDEGGLMLYGRLSGKSETVTPVAIETYDEESMLSPVYMPSLLPYANLKKTRSLGVQLDGSLSFTLNLSGVRYAITTGFVLPIPSQTDGSDAESSNSAPASIDSAPESSESESPAPESAPESDSMASLLAEVGALDPPPEVPLLYVIAGPGEAFVMTELYDMASDTVRAVNSLVGYEYNAALLTNSISKPYDTIYILNGFWMPADENQLQMVKAAFTPLADKIVTDEDEIASLFGWTGRQAMYFGPDLVYDANAMRAELKNGGGASMVPLTAGNPKLSDVAASVTDAMTADGQSDTLLLRVASGLEVLSVTEDYYLAKDGGLLSGTYHLTAGRTADGSYELPVTQRGDEPGDKAVYYIETEKGIYGLSILFNANDSGADAGF